MKHVSLMALLVVLLAAGSALAQTTGGIKGQVRTFDGDGIPRVKITARQKGENVKSVESDDRGNFVLDGLSAGVYNFVFSRKGFSSGLKADVEVKADRIRDLGDELFLDVDRGTQIIVNGSVFGKDGFVVRGARIKIERELSNGKFKKIGEGYTNRQGEFVFRFPEDKVRFRITASARGKTDVKFLEAEEAAIYRLALNLDIERK